MKEAAEYLDANSIQTKLKSMVWSDGCTNWNLDSNGRNTTNYHDNTWKFWYRLYWPAWNDFDIDGDRGTRPMHPMWRVLGATVMMGIATPILMSGRFAQLFKQVLGGLH